MHIERGAFLFPAADATIGAEKDIHRIRNLIQRRSTMKTALFVRAHVALLVCIASGFYTPLSSRDVDMKAHWDSRVVLENPHKGWYHHYPDNHIKKYVIRDDAHLLEFPGMDHLYIRLAWAYLEPREGKYNWKIIDAIINKWTGKGLKISFRISCKETSTDRPEQQYATPRWVMEAGAKGDYYRNGKKAGPGGPWEPVFDDPVFLEKLEHFLAAFAKRYDGKPWLRYIDIGSIGDWGEGHTHSGSRLAYGYEARKHHIDLHMKYFKKTQLVVSDDFVYAIGDAEKRKKLHRHIVKQGISYRDDSPLVDWYVKTYPKNWSVRSPELFEDVYRTVPTVFELQHYHAVKGNGNWTAEEGSSIRQHARGKTGPDFFRGAMRLLHATYIGYHGDAHQWLTDNPELTGQLLNECGYWFFLHQVTLPDPLKIGRKNTFAMRWENRGVAPAYHRYVLKIRLEGKKILGFEMPSENTRWMPAASTGAGSVYKETYTIDLPGTTPPGLYDLKIKLYSPQEKEDVLPALDPGLQDTDGWYRITRVRVEH